MNATQRLVLADGLVKAALLNPQSAAMLGALPGGDLISGVGQKVQGGTWGDAARMTGRSGLEGVGGAVAGGALGKLLMKLLGRSPLAQASGITLGAGMGAMGGRAHGAYAAGQNAMDRHSLVQQVLHAAGR